MKKLLTATVLGLSLLITSPALAYEVKSGDTMGEIATQHGMSLEKLSELNPEVTNINLIYVGENINTVQGQAVQIVSEPVQKVAEKVSVSLYEKDLLARLVRAEAQSESFAGKVAVANVVLNRVESNQFPNSVSAVINQRGQFNPVASGIINKPADAESKKAVEKALVTRADTTSLFFFNSKIATNRWLDSRPTTTVIGNHTFKK